MGDPFQECGVLGEFAPVSSCSIGTASAYRLIPPNGLPLERILEITGALAEALAAAHEKGILHRDLKPANEPGSPKP